MPYRELLLKEIVKNGHAKEEKGDVFDLTNPSFLYLNEDMAKAFLNLKQHPRYKATIIDIEADLLKKHAKDILECIQSCQFNLIDVGASEGVKSEILIGQFPEGINFRYCPVNVIKYLTDLAIKTIKSKKVINIKDYAARIYPDFNNIDEIGISLRNIKYNKNVFLLLNSLLGAHEINDYLFKLANSMLPGDVLVIGNGIRKGERFTNIENYKHPLFDEWFMHLMKILGFNKDEVEYNVRFTNTRIEMYYNIKVDKEVERNKTKVYFKKGDKIIVASLHKYYANELEEFCKMYFPQVMLFKDPEEEYALVICKK